MIIWRGWGVLAAVYVGLAMILFLGVGSTFLDDSALPFSAAIGLIIAGAATWFTGQALNVTGPLRKVEEWRVHRELQLAELVESGQVSLGPGQPQPRSYEEAQQMSEALLQEEVKVAQRVKNVHTLFFIPMQFWAFIFAGIAVFAIVSGIIGIAS
jgi:hypothetical protein